MSGAGLRVYVTGGGLSHIVPSGSAVAALCGVKAWPGQWHGTSNPAEHDTARTMALCVDCRRKVTQPKNRR